jgi:nickel/cobalt exporter
MSDEWILLCATTAGVAFAHTLLGPDHYLPFIGMARAGQWSRAKTLRITALCGLGHVTASLLLGSIGVALGLSLATFDALDSLRGSIAAWGLIVFGLLYAAWGLRQARRGRQHRHWHAHADGSVHTHGHGHADEHVHYHERSRMGAMSGWTLFAVFILGPCEPLIPLLLVPAATGSIAGILLLVAVFTAVTLAAMLGIVWLATAGSDRLASLPGRRFGHAFAGVLVFLCGVSMEFAGL